MVQPIHGKSLLSLIALFHSASQNSFCCQSPGNIMAISHQLVLVKIGMKGTQSILNMDPITVQKSIFFISLYVKNKMPQWLHALLLYIPCVQNKNALSHVSCLHIHSGTVDTRMSHEYITDDHEGQHTVAASFALPTTPGSMAP